MCNTEQVQAAHKVQSGFFPSLLHRATSLISALFLPVTNKNTTKRSFLIFITQTINNENSSNIKCVSVFLFFVVL